MKTQGEIFFKCSQLKKKKKDYAIYTVTFLFIFIWSVQIVLSFFFGFLKLVYELMKISIILLFHQYVQI